MKSNLSKNPLHGGQHPLGRLDMSMHAVVEHIGFTLDPTIATHNIAICLRMYTCAHHGLLKLVQTFRLWIITQGLAGGIDLRTRHTKTVVLLATIPEAAPCAVIAQEVRLLFETHPVLQGCCSTGCRLIDSASSSAKSWKHTGTEAQLGHACVPASRSPGAGCHSVHLKFRML